MAATGALVKGRRKTLHRALGCLVLRTFRRHRVKSGSRKLYIPLTQKQWRDAFDPLSGRLISSDKLIKRIRFGGVELNIRGEVWLFLLNFYNFESTLAERQAQKESKRAEYNDLNRRCSFLRHEKGNRDMEEDHSIDSFSKGNLLSPAKEEFTTWQRIIRLDAVRMNPEWVPYSPAKGSITKGMAKQLASDVSLKEDEHLEPCIQHHAAQLVAILEAYALYDPESGYCQGMGELLSPFVALLDEDYQAFWCFAHFMATARDNFRVDETGIRRQLQLVSQILKVCDPQLYKHLEKIEAANCFFAYRMVVVLMRRELTFEQTISFWEILWADKTAARAGKVKQFCQKGRRKAAPCDDLLVFVVAAAVRRLRKIIMESCMCMDDVLKVCNSMAGQLDVQALLTEGRELLSAVDCKLEI